MHALKLLPTVYMAAVTPASPVPMPAPAQNAATPPRTNTTPSTGSPPPTGPRQR